MAVKNNQNDALYQTASDSTDYQALIDRAVSAGDYRSAAQYEQKRNAKIDAMDALGLNPNQYSKTSLYTDYLDRKSVLDDQNRMDAGAIEELYRQMSQAKADAVDFTVQSAVAQLGQAREGAQKDFAAQRDQINIDEAQARDRQVLYAAARGDRGGITARQYDSISNTAANSRRAIAQQQQQLADETNRQIADLRAQGEFQKAEAVLQLAQQQLSHLWELQQYTDSVRLQEDKLNMQQADLTGIYNGSKTYAAQQAEKEWEKAARKQAYEMAMEMIRGGSLPSACLLESAGMLDDKATYQNMANLYRAQLTAKSSTGGSKTYSKTDSDPTSLFTQMMAGGIEDYETAYAYLSGHKNNYSDKQVENNARNYMTWLQKQRGDLLYLENVDGQLVSSDVIRAYVRLGMIREVVDSGGKKTYHWAENVAQ